MPEALVNSKADIRQRLLITAIRLFAEHGVGAVSMRTINAEAGSKNKSAAHYYFGSKQGIIDGIVELTKACSHPVAEDLTAKIKPMVEKGEASISDVLLVTFMPIVNIYQQPEFGKQLIKLWARMLIETDSAEEDRINELFTTSIEEVLQMLQRLLPEKNTKDLKFHLVHSCLAFTMGLATVDLMDSTPLGDIRFNNEIETLMSLMTYISGGISNQAATVENINLEFWQQYLSQNLFILS